MFHENSGLVVIWLRNVKNGNKKREEVPKLLNLQEVVYALLDAQQTQSND